MYVGYPNGSAIANREKSMTLDTSRPLWHDEVKYLLHNDKETRHKMSAHTPDSGTFAGRTIRTTLGLAAWTAGWTASVGLAAFGPGAFWNDQPTPTLLAIGLSVLVGIGMLFANKRHLQGMDELQRATQLQAMAWTLGAGLVGGVAWTLFARHGLIGFEAEIAHLMVFMGVVYMVGSVAGVLRYR